VELENILIFHHISASNVVQVVIHVNMVIITIGIIIMIILMSLTQIGMNGVTIGITHIYTLNAQLVKLDTNLEIKVVVIKPVRVDNIIITLLVYVSLVLMDAKTAAMIYIH
jgi:hypothetical protein